MEQDIINLDSRVSELERWADRVKRVRIAQAPRTQPDGAGPVGPITAVNNGLTLTAGLLQWGGPLVQNTTIDGVGSAYSMLFTGLDNFDINATTSIDFDALDFIVDATSGVDISTLTTGAIELSRPAFGGTYDIFNKPNGPVLGFDAAGVAWTDADETLANFITRQTGESTNSYTNTTAGITSKLSANPSDARISYDNTVSFESILLKVGPNAINLSALQTTNSTEMELTPFQVLIDSKSKPFKLNEGTTDTGTGTAVPGMVLTLIDETTGEAKYAEAASQNVGVYAVATQNTTQWTPGEAPSVKPLVFDTTLDATSSFTLLGSGALRCDVAGTYLIEADINMIGFSGGAPGTAIVANVLINGLPSSGGGGFMSFYANGYPDSVHLSFPSALVATDLVTIELAKIGGQPGVTNLQNTNRVTITKIG